MARDKFHPTKQHTDCRDPRACPCTCSNCMNDYVRWAIGNPSKGCISKPFGTKAEAK